MAKRKVFMGMLALTFGLVLVFGAGNPNQNNIGEITGDNFALVRAPVVEVVNGTGMEMAFFDGNDLTILNKYEITRAFMGNSTIDLKVTPGSHEFTMLWLYDTETKIITQNYDFKAGKWYDFTSKFLLGGSAPITMREGTLAAGKPKGKAQEVKTFQIEQVYNSDEVAQVPQQVSFSGSPGKVTADKVVVTLTDGTQPGQVVLTLSDGYKFGPSATAANIVKWWMTYPTYPVTVSPSYCTGVFSLDGTQITITMKTSNNRTVTSGHVGFKGGMGWDGAGNFIPEDGRVPDFVVAGGRYPTLE